MRIEAELASQDYGIDLSRGKYAALRAENRGRVAVIEKLLREKV